jgi:hypothetical protein
MLCPQNFYEFFGIVDSSLQRRNAVAVVVNPDDKSHIARELRHGTLAPLFYSQSLLQVKFNLFLQVYLFYK